MINITGIQNIVRDLLTSLSIEVQDIEIVTDHELDLTVINVRTPERGLFTYNHGELLRGLNHIVRKIAETKLAQSDKQDELPQYVLDVNNEQTKLLAELKARARVVVNRVKSFNTEIELEPMSGYERLIIHTFLSKDSSVSTESTGVGPHRRIVVKPVPV